MKNNFEILQKPSCSTNMKDNLSTMIILVSYFLANSGSYSNNFGTFIISVEPSSLLFGIQILLTFALCPNWQDTFNIFEHNSLKV